MNMQTTKDAEFHANEGRKLTAKEVLNFLTLLKESKPEALEQEIHYLFDGEFWSFSGIVLEANEIYLLGNE